MAGWAFGPASGIQQGQALRQFRVPQLADHPLLHRSVLPQQLQQAPPVRSGLAQERGRQRERLVAADVPGQYAVLQVAGQPLELGGMAGDDPGPVFAPALEGRDPVLQAAAQGIPQTGAQLIGGKPVGHFAEIDLQTVDLAYRAGGKVQPVEHAVDHGRQAVAA